MAENSEFPGVPLWPSTPKGYTPRHPELFTATKDVVEGWLDERLLAALRRAADDEGSLAWANAQSAPGPSIRTTMGKAFEIKRWERVLARREASLAALSGDVGAAGAATGSAQSGGAASTTGLAAAADDSDGEATAAPAAAAADSTASAVLAEAARKVKATRARLDAARAAAPAAAAELVELLTILIPGVYTLPVLKPEVCAMMMDEVAGMDASEAVRLERPNSMNRHGAILNSVGWGRAMDHLIARVLCPLAGCLFPAHGGARFDSPHHSFLVKYAMGEDLSLARHRDVSDVTLNVCLGRAFEGGRLYFHGYGEDVFASAASSAAAGSAAGAGAAASAAAAAAARARLHGATPSGGAGGDGDGGAASRGRTFELAHAIGMGVLHMGDHVHGADPIDAGERWNLIVWRNYDMGKTRG